MNFELKDELNGVIKQPPQIFKEVLSILSSANHLSEKDMQLLKNDLLFTILVTIAMENGFQPVLNECEIFVPGMLNAECLSKWKLQSGLFEAKFILLGYNEITTKIRLTPLANTAIVNAVLPDFVSEAYSVCLPIDKYFVFTKQGTKVTQMCCKLKELSDTFKNQVLSPVKSKILSLCGFPGPSLLELPEDIFLKIMFYLPILDIVRVAMTSKKCNQYLQDDNFWHKLMIRDSFKVKDITQADVTWRQSYKDCYKSYMNKRLMRRKFLQLQRQRLIKHSYFHIY